MTQSERPSALVCGNDVLAWGALHALSHANVKVPDEISVAGIGDFKGSKDFEPPLTTVRIPARQIGAKAAHTIARSIVSPNSVTSGELVVPELVVRGTCRSVDT